MQLEFLFSKTCEINRHIVLQFCSAVSFPRYILYDSKRVYFLKNPLKHSNTYHPLLITYTYIFQVIWQLMMAFFYIGLSIGVINLYNSI